MHAALGAILSHCVAVAGVAVGLRGKRAQKKPDSDRERERLAKWLAQIFYAYGDEFWAQMNAFIRGENDSLVRCKE